MSELPSSETPRSGPRVRWTVVLLNLAVFAIILGAIFLPPISLGKRFMSDSFTALGGRTWSVADPDGTELTVLPVGLPDDVSLMLELTSVPRAELEAGTAGDDDLPIFEALPSRLTMKSPLYRIRVRGATLEAATLRIPIPNDAEPLRTLDVYGWSGDGWYRLDSRVREEKDDILVRLDSLPQAVAVVQTQGMNLVFSAPLPAGLPLTEEHLSTLAEIYPEGGLVADDGSILAQPSLSRLSAPGLRVMPTIRNWDEAGKVWPGRVDRIVRDEKLQQAHITALSQFVAQGGYDGLDIDYRSLLPESRAAFSQFISDLAQRLHAQGKLVSVRVSLPMAITPDQWDTGPYDWVVLSRTVDVIRVPMLIDPRAYRLDGHAHAFFKWAVGEADRYKLQLVFVPLAVEQSRDGLMTLSYAEALALLARLETVGVPETVTLGQEVSLRLPVLGRSSGLLYDKDLHTWWFAYLDDRHHERAVWLNNAEGLAPRADLAALYHVRGVSIEGLGEPGNDPNLWPATFALGGATKAPVAEGFSLRWRMEGAGDSTVVETSLAAENAFRTWTAPSIGGTYQVVVSVAQDGQPVVSGDPLSVVVASSVARVTPTTTPLPETSVPPTMPTPTPMPTSTLPTATPTPTPTSTTVPPTATPTPTPTPTPTRAPPTATRAPTPTFTPAFTPTPAFLSAPELFEPESGASFPNEVRLKWTWSRRLEDDEKFAVRWELVEGQVVGDWWVNEAGIVGGGGAIYPVEGGHLFEVNFGLYEYPGGEAYWSVAVFGETLTEKWQISEWSERRHVFRRPRP